MHLTCTDRDLLPHRGVAIGNAPVGSAVNPLQQLGPTEECRLQPAAPMRWLVIGALLVASG